MEDETELRSRERVDHDLLIALHEQVKGIREDIRELKDGMAARMTNVEKRVDKLEKSSGAYLTMTVIYASIGAAMIGLILYHIVN
jgi:hypothetical protein